MTSADKLQYQQMQQRIERLERLATRTRKHKEANRNPIDRVVRKVIRHKKQVLLVVMFIIVIQAASPVIVAVVPLNADVINVVSQVAAILASFTDWGEAEIEDNESEVV